ncbi:NAD(P)-dependent dehydrogenase (short-subunit alcohol dehydrogenase family) [Microbacterium ginsengiterrae]|uniref:NAD(P)-dependent dehydrogenase (Short-subunit alcohol dehydrogenase family) n=1 Tax=Microbacterium ginsengiterrae TaxID=546115 RepID=A0A7W9CBT1_9MICO|nr:MULTISPECIES: SDR family NAD(P)-dependent oxidoreductase [Microbacterium]MBB5742674.1 NAD(P)-dependent dehydrogenase (short-subunit alcohol dehydrogenase family) [Microbacterium ginsengiterrae]
MQQNPVADALVLITGAARGMGELYARRSVAAGARAVALWDIDEDAVTALAADLSRSGVDVRGYRVDVSRREQIVAGLAEVREDLGAPDVVINNAGIVRGAPFWEHDPERDIEATMRINTLAAMWLTREVLPDMIADTSRPKRVLNIASAAGTLANPNMSVYAASKWAMIGWGESVRLELAAHGHRHIGVTTFCPSYVSTGMFEGARGPLLTPIMTPRTATAAAWNGMLRGTPMVLRPWTVKLSMALRGILPTAVWDFVADRVFRVYSSMDEFTGRG